MESSLKSKTGRQRFCEIIKDIAKGVEVIFLIGLGILNWNMQQEIKEMKLARIFNETIQRYKSEILYEVDVNAARNFKREAEHIPGALEEMIKLARERYLNGIVRENGRILSRIKKFFKSENELPYLFEIVEVLDPKLLEIRVTDERGCHIREGPVSKSNKNVIGAVNFRAILKVVDQHGEWFKVKVKKEQWQCSEEPHDASENEGWIWNELVEIMVPNKFLEKL